MLGYITYCGTRIMWPHYVHHTLHSAGDVTIATLTVDSGFNGESPQFTLTCTSSGGPATTVTWTRDSETVSGGMTVLDDPVTAQYTHNLTVTGRLGGQYQCNVSNSRPSVATANYTVQGECNLRSIPSGIYGGITGDHPVLSLRHSLQRNIRKHIMSVL